MPKKQRMIIQLEPKQVQIIMNELDDAYDKAKSKRNKKVVKAIEDLYDQLKHYRNLFFSRDLLLLFVSILRLWMSKSGQPHL